jgi:DNA invertase Pin-like site-specific DNA recombinase
MRNQQPKVLRGQSGPLVIGLIIRNSTSRQVGNYRAESQAELAERLQARGYAVRAYDEQGVSGADLAKRKVATQMLDDLKRGAIQGIAAYDVKRLTRDEFGVDGGTMARRIVEAGGRFITWDKEYDLRNDDDLLQFQFQCFIAGIDWRNIRNTMWSGIFKRVEQEPMFLKPPIGYMTVHALGDRLGRTTKRPAKNPEHTAAMVQLEQAFDECSSLREVVLRLTAAGVQRPAFHGRGGDTTVWSVQTLRYMLKNPIYVGTFVFGRFGDTRGRSTVWNKFAIDQDGSYREFVHHVPELAYWEPARMRRWQRKFGRGTGSRTRQRLHPHPLAGVVQCNSCGQRMTGSGKDTYACPASNTGGTRKDGQVCQQPQWLDGRIAMALLRTVLPGVMFSARELATEAIRQTGDRQPSLAEQRLAYLEERAARIADEYVEMDTPSEALKRKLQEIQRDINGLRDQVSEEQDERLADQQLAAGLQTLLGEPLKLFDTLPNEKQARIYQILFQQVRISYTGRGAGRCWRLLEYAPTFGGGPVKVAESATVRLPNPSEIRVGKRAAGILVVQSAPGHVTATSGLEPDTYQPPTRAQVPATSGWR